jgi:general stress protein 26
MRVHPEVDLTQDELAALSAKAHALANQPQVVTVVTLGRDGTPRFRLMGGNVTEQWRYRTISIKPSSKIQELEANPHISILWKRYDVQEEGIDQPLRFIEVTGRAELIYDGAGIRAISGTKFPHHLDDETVGRVRVGIVVHPTKIRIEGFLPGPRYPVYLPIPEAK